LKAIEADFQFTRVCVGDTTLLWNTSTPADSIFRVLWDLNGDGIFDDAFTDIVKISFPGPGPHHVGLKVIAYSGAMDAIYKQILFSTVNAEFTHDYSCLNRPVHFIDQSVIVEDTASQYIWNFGDGTLYSYLKNPSHNYAFAGKFNVTLTVNTVNGCSDTVQHRLNIQNPPLVDVSFSGDTVFPLGDSVVATVVAGYDSIFWSTGERTTSIVIKLSGYYYVQVYKFGCYGERFFHVTAVEDESFRVMTLFTPNGDGFNDRWEILNIEEMAPCQVDVFNRWGEKVFSSSQYNNDWEGTYRGKALANDTYYYLMRCKDGVLHKGTVNILK